MFFAWLLQYDSGFITLWVSAFITLPQVHQVERKDKLSLPSFPKIHFTNCRVCITKADFSLWFLNLIPAFCTSWSFMLILKYLTINNLSAWSEVGKTQKCKMWRPLKEMELHYSASEENQPCVPFLCQWIQRLGGTFSGWVYWVIKQQARSHSYPELRNFSSFEISYERCGKSERSLFVEGKGQDSDNLSTPPLCFKITNCIAGFFSAGTEYYYWILKHVLSKAPFPGRASHLSFSQVAVLVPCLISKAGD